MWRARLLRLRIAAAVLVGCIAVALLALLDAARLHGRPLRNTLVAGRDVGGLSAARLDDVIAGIEADYRRAPIRIALPGGGFTLTGADIGLTVDRASVRRAALHAGRADAGLGAYLRSFVSRRHVAVPVQVDSARLAAALARAEGTAHVDPVEPRLVVRNGDFRVVPGHDGRGISPAAVAAEIPEAFAAGEFPVTVSTAAVALPSQYSTQDLRDLVAEAQRLTSNVIIVRAEDRSAEVPTKTLRSWVRPAVEGGRLRLRLDRETALAGVAKLLGRVGRPAVDAKLQIDDTGAVSAIPSSPGFRCCAPETADQLEAALGGAARVTVDLMLEEEQPSLTTEAVLQLGVREKVGEFTTKYVPGEDRVRNIHHIADLLRGTVIPPGATFSVNQTIGPRSAANGFVKAHVIEDGVFTENFGGGISQFATTMFNASFFGGLDLLEYQSHSLYISRYPFGREATLSYPHPDLVVRNPSPYGILIWPTYTASTITVSLYSTKFAEGVAAEPSVKKKGLCQIVSTERTRTFTDGRVTKDVIKASYRPKEGVDCEGNPTAGATTTTEAPRDTRPRTRDTAGDGPARTDAAGSTDGSVTDTTRTRTRVTAASAGAGDASGGGGAGDAPDTTRRTATPRPTKPASAPAPAPVEPARPAASVVEPAAPPVNQVS